MRKIIINHLAEILFNPLCIWLSRIRRNQTRVIKKYQVLVNHIFPLYGKEDEITGCQPWGVAGGKILKLQACDINVWHNVWHQLFYVIYLLNPFLLFVPHTGLSSLFFLLTMRRRNGRWYSLSLHFFKHCRFAIGSYLSRRQLCLFQRQVQQRTDTPPSLYKNAPR